MADVERPADAEIVRGGDPSLPGHHVREVMPGIVIGSMDQAHRDAMDEALVKWNDHLAAMKRNGHTPDDPVYAFAYWLYRWSGLIRARASEPTLSATPEHEQSKAWLLDRLAEARTREQVLSDEVAALRAELTQARERLAAEEAAGYDLADEATAWQTRAFALADAVNAIDRGDDACMEAEIGDAISRAPNATELWTAYNAYDHALDEAVRLARGAREPLRVSSAETEGRPRPDAPSDELSRLRAVAEAAKKLTWLGGDASDGGPAVTFVPQDAYLSMRAALAALPRTRGAPTGALVGRAADADAERGGG